MGVDRRSALKVLATAGVTAAVGTSPAAAWVRKEAPTDAVGMLYDATRCIGCKACVVACREANNLPPETQEMPGGLWDAPVDLSGSTKNIIKLYKEGDEVSYVKRQCMHCVDPACTSACVIGALQKREYGIVTWEQSKCVGCRYCQVVCPFNVPKFEWDKAMPRIVKCEMCNHLLAMGRIPACCQVCPREAVIFGKHTDLLEDARKRLQENPGKYVDRVYGEHDVGGTQVLYLSRVPFEKLGLPDLGDDPLPRVSQTVQHGIYKGFIAPVVLYALLGGVMLRSRRAARKGAGEEVER